MNDGGIVVALVLLIGALATGLVGSVYLYVVASSWNARRFLQLLCGWANLGNAIVHALLVVLLQWGDTAMFMEAGVQDADNIAGPAGLMLINGAIGVSTLTSSKSSFLLPLGWNTFVAIAGSLVPMVWHSFIADGMSSWPYTIVFLWLGIYAFESMAFFTALALFFLSKKEHSD